MQECSIPRFAEDLYLDQLWKKRHESGTGMRMIGRGITVLLRAREGLEQKENRNERVIGCGNRGRCGFTIRVVLADGEPWENEK